MSSNFVMPKQIISGAGALNNARKHLSFPVKLWRKSGMSQK